MGDFDMSEVRRFADELEAAPPKVVAKVRGSLTRHVNKMAAGARADAPRDRPWLATEGIAVAVDQERLTRAVTTGADPNGKPVGLFVEFGTSRMAPRPFLYPQLDKFGPEFVSDLERILDKAV